MQFLSFFHATSQTNHYLELFTSNTLDSYDKPLGLRPRGLSQLSRVLQGKHL